MTFEVDVTNFHRRVKEQNLSFTLSMVYAVCKCGNEIENFRYRFVDGAIVLFDKIDTAFTWLDVGILKNVGSFSFEFMGGGRAVVCGVDSEEFSSVLGERACVGMVGGVVSMCVEKFPIIPLIFFARKSILGKFSSSIKIF